MAKPLLFAMSIAWSILCLGLAAAPARADPAKSLAALGTAAKCSDKASPWRPWCIALGWDHGAPGALDDGMRLVGLTIELEDGADVADALSKKVAFAAFQTTKDASGMLVRLSPITPSNDDDVKALGEAVAAVALVFKDKAPTAAIPKDLAAYIKGTKGTHPIAKGKLGWTWTGESTTELRAVGKYWVAVEVPKAANGVWVTILTDHWK